MLAIAFPALDPVLIQLGPFAVRWYALAYIGGLLIGWQVMRRLVRQPGWKLTSQLVDDLLFYATLGVILGGRLGFVFFYFPGYYLAHPLEILFVWQGGMSFHGGLLGIVAAILLFAYRKRVPALEVGDAMAVVAPIGLFFGRIANFINGELWGRPADVPWAVIFPRGGPIARHPSQLYEAMLEGLLLFLVMLWLARTPRQPHDRGLLSGVFLTGYALARFTAEFFRQPDAHLGFLFGWTTMGQLLSLPMLVAGICLIVLAARRSPERTA